MRAVVAVFLSAVLFALCWAPHVHHGVEGDRDCAACVARNADAAQYEVPELAPARVVLVGLVVVAPIQPASVGAPLGSIPGQSPPAIA